MAGGTSHRAQEVEEDGDGEHEMDFDDIVVDDEVRSLAKGGRYFVLS
jgi:hypothetical protein